MSIPAPQSSDFQIDEFYLSLQADGSTISLKSEEEIAKRPFPGLRPFRTTEFQLFKGRDGQAEELLKRLRENNFLAVIGSSGTGKSSLVRAGLIPQLYGGFLHEAGSKWKIAICRPGKDPIKNLAIALSHLRIGKRSANELLAENEHIEPLLRKSSYGILQVKKRIISEGENQKNLLIIIDQFEELFRFDREELKDKDEYASLENDFVQLLLKASEGKDPGIYVAITMRSEFLGDCVRYRGLPEAINKSQYLVPQLTRLQLKDVIELPVLRARKKIAPDLVNVLVNEIESEKLKENLDQLPILQHALMRTYEEAFSSKSEEGERTDASQSKGACIGHNEEMNVTDYERIGGMKNALAWHAKERFATLVGDAGEEESAGGNEPGQLNKKQQIAKLVFQALTDASSDQKGGRRPTELRNICDIAEVLTTNEEEIKDIVEKFRHEDTSFIMPPDNTGLYPKLMLDISHESLMRNWQELKTWMAEEVAAAELYKKLNERREQNDRDKETWIRGILLKELENWRDSGLYNAAWASRYQKPDPTGAYSKTQLYDLNLDYLRRCEAKIEEEIRLEQERLAKEKDAEQLMQAREAKAKRNTLIGIIGVLAAILSATFGIYANSQRKLADSKTALATNETRRANAEKMKAESANASLKQNQIALNSALANEKIARAKAQDASDSAQYLLAELKRLSEEKIRVATANANSMKAKSDSVTDLLAESQIKDEKFYQRLTDYQKEVVIELLKPLKIKDPTSYKTNVQDLDRVVAAKDIAPEDPNNAFYLLQSLNKGNNNVIINGIRSDILRNYSFYKQKIKLDYFNSETALLYNNKDIIGLASSGGVRVARYKNDTLDFGKWAMPKKRKDYWEDDDTEIDVRDVYTTDSASVETLDSTSVTSDSTSTTITVDTAITVGTASTYNKLRNGWVKSNAFYGNNEFVILENNKISVSKRDSIFAGKELIGTLPEGQNPVLASFSSDGDLLLTDDNLTAVRLWSIKDRKVDNLDSLRLWSSPKERNTEMADLKMAPNGQEFLIAFSTDSLQLWSTGMKLIGTYKIPSESKNKTKNKFDDFETKNSISSANISATGSRVLAVLNGVRPVVWTREGNMVDTRFIGNMFSDYNIKKAYISPEGRYLLLVSEKVSVLVNIEKQSYKFLSGDALGLSYQKYNPMGASFLDENHLLTFDEGGDVRLWETGKEIQTKEQLLKLQLPSDLSLLEKFKLGVMDFKDVLSSNDVDGLLELSEYLTEKAAAITNGKDAAGMLTMLEEVNKRLNSIDNSNSRKKLESNLVWIILRNKVEHYNKNVNYRKITSNLEGIIKTVDNQNGNSKKRLQKEVLPLIYTDLAWNYLFLKEFKQAHQAMLQAARIDSTSSLVVKNLALCTLLTEGFSAAKEMYQNNLDNDFKDLKMFKEGPFYNYYTDLMDSGHTFFKDIFKRDIEVLIAAGSVAANNPDVQKALQLLK